MNEMQDKQYLALELTKITFQNDNNGYIKRDKVIGNYNYFLNELTTVFENINTIEELEKKIETLQGLLKVAVDNNPNYTKKLQRITDVINQCKGDMEPYVYECLMAEIQLKIQ